MQETPVEKINKQLDILSKAVNHILIKEYIPSKVEAQKTHPIAHPTCVEAQMELP